MSNAVEREGIFVAHDVNAGGLATTFDALQRALHRLGVRLADTSVGRRQNLGANRNDEMKLFGTGHG